MVQHKAKVAESQLVARLGHEHVREASFGLKVKIPSVDDNDARFKTHSSLVGGALQGYKTML